MHLAGERWTAFFDSFAHEAFRLETLSAYSMVGEEQEYADFLATGRLALPEDDPWLTKLARYRRSGRRVGRVHVVTPPLSDYLRYEFAAYRYNVAAGEDVRILDTTSLQDVPSLPSDFWMLDDSKVVEMRYDEHGAQIARILLESPDLAWYRWSKETAIALSVPLSEYLSD
ncbi:hypothetical protein OG948_20015 [Embleya sp. NBC_00888]|uniref:DUF6879 family protein n=1 Tax=Embleya sp. NBC_00888 TaxID=2975960 RepID=UPI003863F8D1|nr:hypothetical protein OG948_20015 [Embleya sp. NBC_00888]